MVNLNEIDIVVTPCRP